LIVERLIGFFPDDSCATPFKTLPLEQTTWQLIRLGDQTVFIKDLQSEPHLIFDSQQGRVTGSAGCNRLMGSYAIDGNHIRLGPLATTKMLCPQGMDIEQMFLDKLARAVTWNVLGLHLELYDENGALLARFEAH
jgi:heat shock protein HslJ